MILGFKDQFVPMVEDGSKTHTIRGGQRWKVGMRADLFRESRRQKKFKDVRIDGDPGCICLGDGLMGMACHAERHSRYERQQVSGMRLIFRAPVVKVQEIQIIPPPDDFRCVLCGSEEIHCHEPYSRILIDGEELGSDERDMLAWRDGFRPWPDDPWLTTMAFDHMMTFWRGRLPFHGQIVHWDYAARFMDLPKKAKRRYCRSMMCADYGEPVGAAHSCRP